MIASHNAHRARSINFIQINPQLCFYLIFILGSATSMLLAVGLLIGVAWVLNLACSAFFEVAAHIAMLYGRADSLTQLLFILLSGYCFYKVARLLLLRK